MDIPKKLPIFGRTTPDEVLEQIAHGRQQKQIAYDLGVSHQSLNRALRLEQLRRGARNMTELIALFVESKARK
jgi:FixJ family two-component response regulator